MYKRILINGMSGIGDFLYYAPAIKALKERFKDSFITLINWLMVKSLSCNFPYIDELLIFEEETIFKKRPPETIVKLFKEREPYDLVVDFAASPPLSLWIALACRASRRMMFKRGDRYDKFYTDLIELREDRHALESYLEFLRRLEVPFRDLSPKIYFSKKDRDFILKLAEQLKIKQDDFILGLHPGAGELSKRWPKERFACLANKIIKEYGARIIILGSPFIRATQEIKEANEITLAKEVAKSIDGQVINLAGQLTLSQIGLLSNLYLDLYIGNDTGPTHISAISGTPTVSIFGQTNPAVWKPYGKMGFVARRDLPCPPSQSLKELKVADVFEVVKEAIKSSTVNGPVLT